MRRHHPPLTSSDCQATVEPREVSIRQAARATTARRPPFDTTLALLSIALGILVGTGIARNAAAVRRTWREVS